MQRGNTNVLILLDKRRDLLFGSLVAAIAFGVYANSIGNGFVTDDPSVILYNPVLQGSPLSLFSNIDTIRETQLLPFYRPFTYLTFYAEGKLHGFNPFLMHLFNVVLHALNAFLVYWLASDLFEDVSPALLAGLLFAVHPIHSESVNFLSGGRNTMLACLLSLMSLLAHRRSIVQGRYTFTLGGALLFLCGLLSKESAMMVLPFIFAGELLLWNTKEKGILQQSLQRIMPYLIALAVYLSLRWMTLSRLGIQTSIMPGFGMQKLSELYIMPSFAERILSNLYILPKYLLTILWPVALSPRYAVPDDFHLLALPLAVGWASIIGILVWLLKKGRSIVSLFGLCWFIAFWVPVSGIFPMSSILMADRYLYLPAIGLWIIAADQATRLRQYGKTVITYSAFASALICVVLAGTTILRNTEWKDEISLFSRMVEEYPENPHGYFHLGMALLKRRGPNDLQMAEKNLETLLALDPQTQSAQTPLGIIRLETGDYEGALYYFTEALMHYPLDIQARINRAITYEKLGRYKEAFKDYQFFLTIPDKDRVPGSSAYAEARIRELSQDNLMMTE